MSIFEVIAVSALHVITAIGTLIDRGWFAVVFIGNAAGIGTAHPLITTLAVAGISPCIVETKMCALVKTLGMTVHIGQHIDLGLDVLALWNLDFAESGAV